jgi:hypothetical protein
VPTSSLWMSLLSYPLRKKYFTITLCSIQSVQICITHMSNVNQKRSSQPDPIDRFARWTQMFDSQIDWVSRMSFGYWQFSVLRKIGGGAYFFAILYPTLISQDHRR